MTSNFTPAAWKKVNKAYRRGLNHTDALHDFDMELKAGITQGLLGDNGSGKSTAIKLLLGLGRPDSGTVEIFGRNPAQPENRQKVGFLPEIFQSLPELKVKNILELFAGLKSIAELDLASYADNFLLADWLDKKFKNLSRGIRQRVGLATAFLGGPELLVLDEPTAGLDIQSQEKLYPLLKKRTSNDKTNLVITHRPQVVELICNRIIKIDAGRVTEINKTKPD
jgi:ABC-type multidrug transport system ATPase subunit